MLFKKQEGVSLKELKDVHFKYRFPLILRFLGVMYLIVLVGLIHYASIFRNGGSDQRLIFLTALYLLMNIVFFKVFYDFYNGFDKIYVGDSFFAFSDNYLIPAKVVVFGEEVFLSVEEKTIYGTKIKIYKYRTLSGQDFKISTLMNNISVAIIVLDAKLKIKNR